VGWSFGKKSTGEDRQLWGGGEKFHTALILWFPGARLRNKKSREGWE